MPKKAKSAKSSASNGGANLGFEAKLWAAADALRNNMDAAEYKHVVLGLIFLKYISDAFEAKHAQLVAEKKKGADPEDPDEYRADNIFWVPPEARWAYLKSMAPQPTIGQLVDDAMTAIERDNTSLKGVLPKDYARPGLDKQRLGQIINLVSDIALGSAADRAKDTLGRVYEYFLSRFASAEGKSGGQFYTPAHVVRVLVEVLAPYKGRVYDPCCGSGGMFVQSEKFIEAHSGKLGDISIYGQESNYTTWRLAKMNLALRGIDAQIAHGEAPIEHDPHWPVVSLAEITSKIGSGATPRGGSDTYLPSRTRFALVRSQNVFDRRLRAIFDEGKPDWLSEIAQERVSASDVVQLLDTQSYFDMLKMPYPATRDGVLDRLQREHIVCETVGGFSITNLGATLFAKKLEDFGALARKAPRVIVYEGTGKLKTRIDKPGTKGYAVGFEGLIEFINGQIPSNEVIEKALRRQVKMFPEIAIRELVANALIHQDFNETGTSVVIEIYTDRMEIASPGKPFIAPDRFIDEYQSRNERLADLMRRLGICEEKGSGIDKVVNSAEVYQLPAPDFRISERKTISVLFGHKSFEDMDRNDRIRACYQHCCLRYVTNEKTSNQSLRERFKLPEEKAEAVSRTIRETMRAGLVKADNPEKASKRYARYLPYWA